MNKPALSPPIKRLFLLCWMPGVFQLQALGFGFNGPELTTLAGPNSSSFGLLLVRLLGTPVSPWAIHALGFLLLIATATLARGLVQALLGRPFGEPCGQLTLALVIASPLLAQAALDLRGLPPLAALALGCGGVSRLLRAPGTKHGLRLVAAGAALSVSGFLAGWLVAPLAFLLIALPYRDRVGPAKSGARAILAAAAAALGSLAHNAPAHPFELQALPGTTLAVALAGALPLAIAFFKLPKRRLALLVGTLASLAAARFAPLLQAPFVSLAGSLALLVAFSIALSGLVEPTSKTPRRRQSLHWLPTLLGVAAIGLASFNFQSALAQANTGRTGALALIQSNADATAKTGVDTAVFVISPAPKTPADPAFGPGLALALAPPFSSATVAVQVVPTSRALMRALAEQRSRPGFTERALLVFASGPKDGPALTALAPPRAGWPTPKLPTFERTDSVTWSLDPPVAVHTFGALALEVPSIGLDGVVTMHFGSRLSATHNELEFPLELGPAKAGSTRTRLELPLPSTLASLVGPPLVELTFEGNRSPDLAPRLLAAPTHPSILQPAPGTELDLSRDAPPPRLHVVLDPALPHPTRYTLELDIEVPGGQLEFSASGPLPASLSGDLELTPTTLDPRARPSGVPAMPWRSQLATGLAQALERSGGTGLVTIWIHFEGPGGLDLGSTPEQVHSFRATPP